MCPRQALLVLLVTVSHQKGIGIYWIGLCVAIRDEAFPEYLPFAENVSLNYSFSKCLGYFFSSKASLDTVYKKKIKATPMLSSRIYENAGNRKRLTKTVNILLQYFFYLQSLSVHI